MTFYLTALSALLFAIAAVLILLNVFPAANNTEGFAGIYILMGVYILPIVAVPYVVLCLAGLYIYDRVNDSWYSKSQKAKCATRYGERWLGLWHGEDEAISALVNVKHVSGPIIPSTFLVPFLAVLPLLLTLGIAVYLVLDLLVFGKGILGTLVGFGITGVAETGIPTDWAGSILKFVFGGALGDEDYYATGAIGFTGVILASITATYLATLLLKALARLLGWPLSSIMNGLIWSSIRHRAWGDDRLKEAVSAAGARPPEFASGFPPLPDAVADPISEHSEKNAILTLTKVREILGMAGKPQSSPNVVGELSENLNWRELIHTSYFDVPEFIDLAAIGLHRDGLAALRDDYWQGVKREQADAHYAMIRAIAAT